MKRIVSWLCVFVILINGCGISYKKTTQVKPYVTTKKEVYELFGSPDRVRHYPQQIEWEYNNMPPQWPLYIPLFQILYALYYYFMADTRTVFRCFFSQNGIVVAKQYEGSEVDMEED